MGPSMNSLDGGGGVGSTGPPSSGGVTDPGADVDLQPETQPPGPQATLVENMDLNECSPHDSHHDMQGIHYIPNLPFEREVCGLRLIL